MKLLVTYQKFLAFAFTREKTIKKKSENIEYPLGFKSLFPLLNYTCSFVLLFCAFFTEIETPQDFCGNVYILLTAINNGLNFMLVLWNRQKIFAFIDQLEHEIDKRKL